MAGNYRPLDGLDRTVNMIVRGAAVEAGDGAALATDGCDEVGDGEWLFGVFMTDGAIGDEVAVWRGPGRLQCKAATGFNPDRGDPVYCAAGGEVDAGASGNRSAGIVVDADPASGGTVIIDFDPWGAQIHSQVIP